MKPPGLEFRAVPGSIIMRVTPVDRVADKIYDAVQDAILAGWTPARFKREAAEAWDYELEQAKKAAASDWAKP